MALEIRSRAFKPEGTIPQEYTCDGSNISPPIEWRGVPRNAESLVIIANDPDAPGGTFTHWAVFNIPPTHGGLDENQPREEILRIGAQQAVNDTGNIGYGGPCPPQGVHRYFFNVYALDTSLGLPRGSTADAVHEAMKGHIIDQGELMVRYKKQG